jgi:RNA polymerase sigma factor (sigma-70 family)
MQRDGPSRNGGTGGNDGAFPNTRWTVVLEAQDDTPGALAAFCQAYWNPLFCFARRMDLRVADAEDLTQAFFTRLLARDLLLQARRERGRLRSFLLKSFSNFIAEESRRQGAQKRGGGQPVLRIDSAGADARLELEPLENTTPELEYERAWARQLLRQTLARLESDYAAAGNGALFEALRDMIVDGSAEKPLQAIADELGRSEASVRFAAFTLRQRYRAVLRELVADTVAEPDEIDDELAHLRSLFHR